MQIDTKPSSEFDDSSDEDFKGSKVVGDDSLAETLMFDEFCDKECKGVSEGE